MKPFLLVPLLFLIACDQKASQPAQEASNPSFVAQKVPHSTENPPITFTPLDGAAILVGADISLLDEKLNVLKTLPEGTLTSILGISDSLFQPGADYCDAFRYVHLDVDGIQGMVDGRNVFHLSDSDQDTSFSYSNTSFTIKTTTFFGIGPADDDGLSFCSKFQNPVVLIDHDAGTSKLVPVSRSTPDDYASSSFLELVNSDMAYDEIERIEPIDGGVRLTIRRKFQEGHATFKVELMIDGSEYKAAY